MDFMHTFGTRCSPINSLVFFLPATDVVHLSKTCKAMHGAVNLCLTPDTVNELATLLWKLPPGRPFSLEWAPEKCRMNRRFVELAVRRDVSNFAHVGPFREDTLVCKTALISAVLFSPEKVQGLLEEMGPEISGRIDSRMLSEGAILSARRQFWLEYGLSCLVDKGFFNNDKEVVLASVQQYGRTLVNASPEMQADKEIVLAAVHQDGRALAFASPKLRSDKEAVLAAVQQYGMALLCASFELKADRTVVLAAVRQDGMALEFASPDLRADKEVVLAAVRRDRKALQFASSELRQRSLITSSSEGWLDTNESNSQSYW